MAQQSITLPAGQSQVVSFEVTPTVVKTYQVSVDGLTGSFSVATLPSIRDLGMQLRNGPLGGRVWRYTFESTTPHSWRTSELAPVDQIAYIRNITPGFLVELIIFDSGGKYAPYASEDVIYWANSYAQPYTGVYKPPLPINEPGLYEYDCSIHNLVKIS